MSVARDTLINEQCRKQALRDSYRRQLSEVEQRRTTVRGEMETLRRDMAKVKPPSALLQRQYDDLMVRDRRHDAELKRIAEDITALEREIMTLGQQIQQLGTD